MLGGVLILAMGNARPEAARWTALVVALLHPQSREYQRIWFK